MKKFFFIVFVLVLFFGCENSVDPKKTFEQYQINNKSDFSITVNGETIEPNELKVVKDIDSSFANGYITRKIKYDGKDYSVKLMKYTSTAGLYENRKGKYTCFVTVENVSNITPKEIYTYSIKNNTNHDLTVKIYPYGSSSPIEKSLPKVDVSGNATTINLAEIKYQKPVIKIFCNDKQITSLATPVNADYLTLTETSIANKQNAVLISVNTL